MLSPCGRDKREGYGEANTNIANTAPPPLSNSLPQGERGLYLIRNNFNPRHLSQHLNILFLNLQAVWQLHRRHPRL